MTQVVKSKRDIKEYESIFHIEVAAGYGMFGKLFYKECILSDKDEECYNNNLNIDLLCDAMRIPFNNDRFNIIILCNPYNFGFMDIEEGIFLLKEFIRIIKDKGKILIIGNSKWNPWCNIERIMEIIEQLKAQDSLNLGIEIDKVDNNSFNPKKEYNNYIFLQTGGIKETRPDMRLTIHVTK